MTKPSTSSKNKLRIQFYPNAINRAHLASVVHGTQDNVYSIGDSNHVPTPSSAANQMVEEYLELISESFPHLTELAWALLMSAYKRQPAAATNRDIRTKKELLAPLMSFLKVEDADSYEDALSRLSEPVEQIGLKELAAFPESLAAVRAAVNVIHMYFNETYKEHPWYREKFSPLHFSIWYYRRGFYVDATKAGPEEDPADYYPMVTYFASEGEAQYDYDTNTGVKTIMWPYFGRSEISRQILSVYAYIDQKSQFDGLLRQIAGDYFPWAVLKLHVRNNEVTRVAGFQDQVFSKHWAENFPSPDKHMRSEMISDHFVAQLHAATDPEKLKSAPYGLDA